MSKQRISSLYFLFSCLFALSLLVISPLKVEAAHFYLSPESGNYKVGQIFKVNVFINSDDASINAAKAEISFPKNILAVKTISKDGSIFSLWFQNPVFSNSEGKISFGGGIPSPGFKGMSGKVITINFQAKSVGQVKLVFKDKAIIENGPSGKNLCSSSLDLKGNYNINKISSSKTQSLELLPPAPKIISLTHPSQNKWYSNDNPDFKWSIPQSVVGISFILNQDQFSKPNNVSQGIFSSKSFKNLRDGIWYFHLKFKNKNGWGPSSCFRVQIDTSPPSYFKVISDNKGDSTNPRPLLYLKAKDDTSGIAGYKIKIGDKFAFNVSTSESYPFILPVQYPGVHSIKVIAFDKAGNSIEKGVKFKVDPIISPNAIICPSSVISGSEVIYIEGKSKPKSQISVFFRNGKRLVKKRIIISGKDGEWSLTENDLFMPGKYNVTAIAKDDRGALSKESTICSFRIISSGISIGRFAVSYKTISIFLLSVLFLLIVSIYLILRRDYDNKKLIREEIDDLRNKFYKEYNEFWKDIEDRLETIKEKKSNKRKEDKLIKDLKEMKNVFEKELKDVEDIER